MVAKINRLNQCLRQIFTGLLSGFFLTTVLCHSALSAGSPSLLRDEETEELLHQIIHPLFNAADIHYNPEKIFILNDQTLNAFVSNGNYLFVHTGTLINAENVNQLNGILAHETGHIAGGHIARQKLQLNKLRALSVVSLIAAGAAAATSGRSDAAMAVLLGSQSGIINGMIAYQLQEERNADESAVRYLQKIKQSPQGLGDFMKKIQSTNRLSGYEETPYFRTHPLSIERLRYFEEQSKISTGVKSSALDESFKLVKAKLSAFLLPVERTEKLYPETDRSTAGRYARCIINYRKNNLDKALQILDGLIGDYPNNAYFHELKGQFLFESGKLNEALKSYQKAKALKPQSIDITLGWAQTAIELPHTPEQLKEIITALNRIVLNRSDPTAWLILARAYEENNQKADSLYASAKYSLEINNIEAARRQIAEAEKQSPSKQLQLRLKDLKNQINREDDI